MVTQAELFRQAAERAGRGGITVSTRFFPRAESGAAVHAARQAGVSVCLSGGWPDAERVAACFSPEGEEAAPDVRWVRVTWNTRFAAPTHRELLGSLMGLGIDRSWFGDLLLQEDAALLCCLPPMDSRLPLEWTQAGRCAIRVSALEAAPEVAAPAGDVHTVNVASLRLDCVLAGALRISRARAAELIRAGQVEVAHLPEERIDRQVAPDEVLSVRGHGRIIVREVGQPTRKDRLPITVELFLRRT